MGQVIPIKIEKTRAVVQSANSFGSVSVVIWEYIANGIDYINEGTKPQMEVIIEKDKIIFSDNGRGLDTEDLQNFFTAYAENRDRVSGNYSFLRRGYFGTGGFSVFKIAKSLNITSVKNKKLYSGKISFDDIKKDKGFELDTVGKKTDLANGTKFEVSNFYKEITKKQIVDIKDYVQKQMMNVKGAEVWINNDLLEYKEPAIEKELTKIIKSKDTVFYDDLNDLGFGAGNITLTLKKTKKPLPKGEYGIAVLGDGNLLEVCSPGIETKKYCDYIIGEAEIENIYQNLEKFDPPLFDQSRRRELSLENKYVLKLRAFIGIELEKFEKEVSNVEKEREQSKMDKELNKKLDQLSQKTNEVLNNVWDKLNLNSLNSQNLSKKSKKLTALKDVITNITKKGEDFYLSNKNKNKKDKNDSKPFDKKINKKNNSKEEEDKSKTNNSGGLLIKQKGLGEDEGRAYFDEKRATIFINTDFPLIKRFIEKGDYENKQFDLLLKEIALTELSIAITTILQRDGYYGDDNLTALVDLRNRINDFSIKLDSV